MTAPFSVGGPSLDAALSTIALCDLIGKVEITEELEELKACAHDVRDECLEAVRRVHSGDTN